MRIRYSVNRSPFAAHGKGDGQSHLWRSQGDGWLSTDNWGDSAELRRMPYALAAPGGTNRLLVGLRGGTLLLTNDRGELSLHLPGVIDLATAPG